MNRANLKKIFYILGDSKRKVLLFSILFIFLSVLEIASLGLIAPYIALIISPEDLYSNQYLINFLSSFSLDGQPDRVATILILSLFMVIIFSIKFFGTILINFFIMRFCLNQGVSLRSELVDAYHNLEYQDFIKRNTSEYIYNLQGVVTIFSQSVLQALLRLLSDGLIVLFIIFFLLWQNPLQISSLLFLVAFFGLLYDRVFRFRLSKYGKEANFFSAHMIKKAQESFDGYKEVQVLNLGGYFVKSVTHSAEKYAGSALKSSLIKILPRALFELVLIIFIVLLVVFSVFSQSDNSVELFTTLGLLGVASKKLIPSLTQIVSSVSNIRHGENTIDIIYKDLSISRSPSIQHGAGNSARQEFETLAVDSVSFSYSGNIPAIKDTSFFIKKGETVGIIGQSGAGKTTLIDILLGFLKIDKGEILYNGQDIYSVLESWREGVAYIPQNVFLVDGSLKSNIAIGIDESCVDSGRLEAAIQGSQLVELVETLEHGVDTNIGEKGVKISGGQRQRVALARAFYHDKGVIIMDEATSALDSETEEEVVNEIRDLKGEKTIIIVAHRLSTLRHCDRIYEVCDGKVVLSDRVKLSDIS